MRNLVAKNGEIIIQEVKIKKKNKLQEVRAKRTLNTKGCQRRILNHKENQQVALMKTLSSICIKRRLTKRFFFSILLAQ